MIIMDTFDVSINRKLFFAWTFFYMGESL